MNPLISQIKVYSFNQQADIQQQLSEKKEQFILNRSADGKISLNFLEGNQLKQFDVTEEYNSRCNDTTYSEFQRNVLESMQRTASPAHVFPPGVEIHFSKDPVEDAQKKSEFDGVFNYQEQIQKIQDLKNSGFNLKFIVGRGNVESNANDLPTTDKSAWVYSGYWPYGQSSRDPKPNLWLDIQNSNYADALKKDLSETFKEIWIDIATWNWISERYQVLSTLHELLADGGKLIIQNILIGEGMDTELEDGKTAIDGFIPTSITYPLSADEKLISKARERATYQTAEVYRCIFGEAQLKCGIYPPSPSAGNVEYFEIAKTKHVCPSKYEIESYLSDWKRGLHKR